MADFAAALYPQPDAVSPPTGRAAAFLVQSGVEARAAHHTALVLDELLTNVATHGGAEASVSVSLMISPDRVTVEVVDGGALFDPRVEQTPDVSAGAQERPLGG